MDPVHQQRCVLHAFREAAARCPDCGRFFCRECVTEHDGRVICAGCLRRLADAAPPPRRRVGAGFRLAAQTALSVVLLWLLFYGVGRLLLRIPAAYHEGTVWSGLLREGA